MKIVALRSLFKTTTLFATAFVLAVSTLTAAVPFILSKTSAAAAPYNVIVMPKCENGLVSFDVTGTNPAGTQPAVWVKASAAFKLSEAQLVQPGTTASFTIKTDVASVPVSAATIFTSSDNVNYSWLNEPSAIASYNAFNCYDTVYVATTGSDSNTGTTLSTPFETIQKALDTVNVNGTVNIADGSYNGTANMIKDGVKLVGTTDSRDTVKLYTTALSGQAGLFVNGANNVTIKNLGVYGDNFNIDGSGALIKLNNGSNARIENVVVKNSSASGININSYSDVTITNVFVAGAGKDGLSVNAQQTATDNVAKNITITNSSFSGAAWSAIAFYTTAKTGNTNSIKDVTLANVSTQYGERGLYIEGAGGTVTSPSSDKLILQNFYAGDNSNEYINNEQTADIDARGIRINIGNGVVVPANQMTQAQYDATLLKIKDRNNKSPVGNNYGRVQLVDLTAPELTVKANGTALTGLFTNQKDVVAEWTKPVGTTSFIYKSWTTNGSQYNETNPYTVTGLTETSRSGSFVLGDGTYFINVVAVDALGNEKESNTFSVTFDETKPTISGVTNGVTYRGTVNNIQISDTNFDKLSINGNDVPTQTTNGSVYTLVNPVSGDGTYVLVAKDKAGNETTLTFKIDNSVEVVVGSIDTTVANPTITGRVTYVVGGAPVANKSIIVTVDDVDYATETNEIGVWTITARNLGNGAHRVLFGTTEVASFTTELPVVTPAGGASSTPIPLVPTEPAADPTVPTIISPSTFATVLGTSASDSAGVEGAATENKDTLAAANTEANNGTFLGLGWYWWLLILALLAAIAWWIVSAVRKRQAE